MSFRELRNFAEMMRALGYPRLISVESFRQPNFTLVADVLNWLVKRYDPTVEIPFDIGTEGDRVQFLKLVAQVMSSRARIKLGTKKLYMADGYAVKELLKIATLLYDATTKYIRSQSETTAPVGTEVALFNINDKISELKAVRSSGTEITEKGAALHDLLAAEVEGREARQRSIARPLDTDDIEQNIRMQIKSMQDDVTNIKERLENLQADETNLESKVEKKKAELERNQKRLKSLSNVRPAFMDEYEKLEAELQQMYTLYMERFRNLEYLENRLEAHNRAEQQKFDESERALKEMQRKMQEEEQRVLREGRTGGFDGDLSSEDGDAGDDSFGEADEVGMNNDLSENEFEGDEKPAPKKAAASVPKKAERSPAGGTGHVASVRGSLDNMDEDSASFDDEEKELGEAGDDDDFSEDAPGLDEPPDEAAGFTDDEDNF